MTSQEAMGLLWEEAPFQHRAGLPIHPPAGGRGCGGHRVAVAGACALVAAAVVAAAAAFAGGAGRPPGGGGAAVVVAASTTGGRGLLGSTPTTSGAPRPPVGAAARPGASAARTTTTGTATTTAPSSGAAQRRLFRLVENPDGTVAVRTSNGGYISASRGGKLSTAAAIGRQESFRLVDHPGGTITLESWTGAYISARGGEVRLDVRSGHVAKGTGKFEKLKKIEKEDGFIMLETVGGDYVSSEAFSDERGRFAIYTREAEEAGDAERFRLEVNSDHTESLRSLHGTYLGVDSSGSVVAGSMTVGKHEKFERRRNGDGTVSLLAAHGGRYVTAFENGTVRARSTERREWERFRLTRQKDGSVSLQAWNRRYLSVSKLPILTFYMYRAQGRDDWPLHSVNAGNIAGVMWYLHNEVVVETPRKYGIERIYRMKVQTTSTKALSEVGLNFGVRFAYDTGECTGAGPINGLASCRDLYARLGHFIGCNYLGDYPFPMASKGYPSFYEGGMWYSLPKEGACISAPHGADNCTFSYEDAGSVDIGDLYGMGDGFGDWYSKPDSKEFDRGTDAGVGCDFWNGIRDVEANKRRVRRALDLFRERYPDMPSEDDYPDPVCDFNCRRFYSREEMERVGEECQCSEHAAAVAFLDRRRPEACKLDATSGLQDVGYYQR